MRRGGLVGVRAGTHPATAGVWLGPGSTTWANKTTQTKAYTCSRVAHFLVVDTVHAARPEDADPRETGKGEDNGGHAARSNSG